MKRPVLMIMAKAPRVGAVKTRLARDIGGIAAWRFHRNMLAALVRRLTTPFWRLVMFVTPDRSRFRLPVRAAHVNQGHGDLGQRMARGLSACPTGVPVVLIGCDIPGITTPIIRSAFDALKSHDVVFGPATDGGFWLIGWSGRRRFWRPFAGVRWSQHDTLAATMKNFKGRRFARAVRLSDVDDLSSWLSARDAL